MSITEMKSEINKAVEHLSENALKELLMFLKDLENKESSVLSQKHAASFERILKNDDGLLKRLAQ